VVSSIFHLFFLAYSQPSQIGCLPYFHTWCDLSANSGRRSETCCTQLAENTGCKKSPKIRHLRTITQLCPAISSQLRHVSTIRKNLLNRNNSPTCPYNMVNFSPLAAEIGSLVWGTPAMYFMILLSVLVFYFHSFVNMCACHVYFKINLLTYLLSLISMGFASWQCYCTAL